MDLAAILANRVGKEFLSLKRNGLMYVTDDVVTVTGFAFGESEAFCKDVDSIVYNEYEGKVKELQWCVVEDLGYVQFLVVPEKAKGRKV